MGSIAMVVDNDTEGCFKMCNVDLSVKQLLSTLLSIGHLAPSLPKLNGSGANS